MLKSRDPAAILAFEKEAARTAVLKHQKTIDFLRQYDPKKEQFDAYWYQKSKAGGTAEPHLAGGLELFSKNIKDKLGRLATSLVGWGGSTHRHMLFVLVAGTGREAPGRGKEAPGSWQRQGREAAGRGGEAQTS